jgi:hypothetical protein
LLGFRERTPDHTKRGAIELLQKKKYLYEKRFAMYGGFQN